MRVSGMVVSTVASLSPSVQFHHQARTCLCGVYVGSLRVLWLPPTVPRHAVSQDTLIGNTKLLIGVNVGVNVSAIGSYYVLVL